VRVSYGHPLLHILLRREGWQVNHKRTGRLYREEGLQLGRRRGPKRPKAVTRSRPLRRSRSARMRAGRWISCTTRRRAARSFGCSR
jgi:hypothetical protein